MPDEILGLPLSDLALLALLFASVCWFLWFRLVKPVLDARDAIDDYRDRDR